MKVGIIGAGAAVALASLLASGISVTVRDCPQPVEELDYSKLAEIPFLPEAKLYTPLPDYSRPRTLNQRQKRKRDRQQPQGKFR